MRSALKKGGGRKHGKDTEGMSIGGREAGDRSFRTIEEWVDYDKSQQVNPNRIGPKPRQRKCKKKHQDFVGDRENVKSLASSPTATEREVEIGNRPLLSDNRCV